MSRGSAGWRHWGSLVSAGLGWLAGTAWQLQAADLASRTAVLSAWVVAAALVWARSRVRASRSIALLALAAALLGWGTTTWRAQARLADRLDPALEGVTLELEGEVQGLPQRGDDGVRFDFVPDGARPGVPGRVRLGWWGGPGSAPAAVEPGERWRLAVRLKQVHGVFNPGGFDQELQAFEQGIGATGSVVSGSRRRAARGEWVSRARAGVRGAIHSQVTDPSAAGLLAALSVGDQAAIGRADWAVFRVTGVAHLVAISGMYVHSEPLHLAFR